MEQIQLKSRFGYCGKIRKCAKTLPARFIQGTTEVESAQVRNKIYKRKSYQLEAVQYACPSTGSGTSLNLGRIRHRTGGFWKEVRFRRGGEFIHFERITRESCQWVSHGAAISEWVSCFPLVAASRLGCAVNDSISNGRCEWDGWGPRWNGRGPRY